MNTEKQNPHSIFLITSVVEKTLLIATWESGVHYEKKTACL